MTKILLGTLKSDAGTEIADGEVIYLSKHKWDCGWYWGFGYVGNVRSHFHFESLIKNTKTASELFDRTNIADKEWWVIRDLFVQAYALQKAAEVYRYGGHQTSLAGVTDIIKNPEIAKQLNADLEKVLDVLWDYVVKSTQTKL
jgi:hypothetical protein